MAQHDYVISNGTGAAVRSDLNNALLAIVSQNSGATEPTTTYAYQWWADTTTGLLKIRNSANNAWITLRELDGTLTIEDGTVSAPGLAFRDDLNTGIWRPGTDQFAISTNGVERVEWGTSEVVFNDGGTNYDFRVEGDTNANLLFVDASADAIGVGTSSPAAELQVNKTSDVNLALSNSSSVTSGNRGSFSCYNSSVSTVGVIRFAAVTDNVGTEIQFYTRPAAGSLTQTMTLDSSGRLGVGTTAPAYPLSVSTVSNVGIGINNWAAIGDGGANDLRVGGLVASQYTNLALFTGGTERCRLDSSGRLLVGTSTARANMYNSVATATLQLEAVSATTGAGRISVVYNDNSADSSSIIIGKSRATTVGGSTVVQSGDALGNLSWQGADGSELVEAASIRAEVDATPGANDMPGRLVFSTTADGASSPTERLRINQAGHLLYDHANVREQGSASNFSQFGNNTTLYPTMEFYAKNTSYASSIQQNICARSANSAYNFLIFYSGNAADVETVFRGNGDNACDGSWTGGGADYAEYFEWSDSNADAEDRRGISVVLDGDKIRKAVAGEDPVGVISGNPSVVGDAAWNKWTGKYLRDEFGSYLLDENGDRQLNAAYDPDVEYIPREQRPEWDCVGLMGKLRIRKGQITGSRWIKMRDISDTVEEWLVR